MLCILPAPAFSSCVGFFAVLVGFFLINDSKWGLVSARLSWVSFLYVDDVVAEVV